MNHRDQTTRSASFLWLRPSIDARAAGLGDFLNFVRSTEAADDGRGGLKRGAICHGANNVR